jgi:hypothetical protein
MLRLASEARARRAVELADLRVTVEKLNRED